MTGSRCTVQKAKGGFAELFFNIFKSCTTPHFVQNLMWSGEGVWKKRIISLFKYTEDWFALCIPPCFSYLLFLITPETLVVWRISKFTSGWVVLFLNRNWELLLNFFLWFGTFSYFHLDQIEKHLWVEIPLYFFRRYLYSF